MNLYFVIGGLLTSLVIWWFDKRFMKGNLPWNIRAAVILCFYALFLVIVILLSLLAHRP